MKKIRVLFVCLGNICRSPLAEAIFNHKLRQTNFHHLVEADSCGTSNYHIGESPDPRTIANAKKNGVSIEHSGRQFDPSDFERFDFILAMDRSNLNNIMKVSGSDRYVAKVALMRNYDPKTQGGDVPDPYYGGEAGFEEVFSILDRSVDELLSHIERSLLHGKA